MDATTLNRNALSLAAAGVLAVTACAWGVTSVCKQLREQVSASQGTTEQLKN